MIAIIPFRFAYNQNFNIQQKNHTAKKSKKTNMKYRFFQLNYYAEFGS